MIRRALAAIGLILFLGGMGAVFYVVYVRYQWTLSVVPVSAGREAPFIVRQGEPFGSVAARLEQAGLVSSARNLRFLARYRGDSDRIKAGEYELSPAMRMDEVYRRLIEGRVVMHSFTVPEGLRLTEIAGIVERASFCRQGEFLALAVDPGLLAEAGLTADSFEGYLFPETYTLAGGVPCRQVVLAMYAEFSRRFTPEMERRAADLGLTRHQTVTLASIVEKETGWGGERALIASVFHNRLKRGMPLQSDPTVIYGMRVFDGNLKRSHLETDHPHNTYTRGGIPPGPIASPGEAALNAVLAPARTAYLFFVSMNNGRHHFSATLAEHNEAVRIYQVEGRKGPAVPPSP